MKVNESEYMLEKRLIELLNEYGYPKESIITEYPINNSLRADLIVVDKNTNSPVMCIEIKSLYNKYTEEKAYQQLRKYYFAFDVPVKTIGALFDIEKRKFKFIDYTPAFKDNDRQQVDDNFSFPTYDELINGTKQKIIKVKKDKQNSNIRTLKVICWGIIPILCILLLLLNYFELYEFTTERLIVIGILFSSLLIPCFKTIKVGEVSLEREIEQQKEEQNNG